MNKGKMFDLIEKSNPPRVWTEVFYSCFNEIVEDKELEKDIINLIGSDWDIETDSTQCKILNKIIKFHPKDIYLFLDYVSWESIAEYVEICDIDFVEKHYEDFKPFILQMIESQLCIDFQFISEHIEDININEFLTRYPEYLSDIIENYEIQLL